ncbi:MAG TPA: SRPBCC family protein [Anaerolineales bacterium]|nr:SRPBCC family protein [Anaerolineales bacterium]
MKYKLELPIHKPRAEVWKIFDDPDNMNKWQPSLIKIECVNGTAGQPGAVSRLTFKSGEREYALTETVLFRAEPERLDGVYENEYAENVVRNIFLEQGQEATLWKVEVIFRFKTLFMKILGTLKKKNFVIRTQRDMERFKALAENS